MCKRLLIAPAFEWKKSQNIYLSMENRPPVAGEEGRDGWKVLKMAVYKIISICLYGWRAAMSVWRGDKKIILWFCGLWNWREAPTNHCRCSSCRGGNRQIFLLRSYHFVTVGLNFKKIIQNINTNWYKIRIRIDTKQLTSLFLTSIALFNTTCTIDI